MGYRKLGQAVWGQFTTTQFSSGALLDATGTPVGKVTKNGTDDALAVTVTKLSTGRYKWTCTPSVGASFADGDQIQVSIAATIDSVAAGGVVAEHELTTKEPTDLGTDITTNLTAIGNLNDPSAAAIVTALFNNASMKQMLAFARGKVVISGGGTIWTFYDTDDTTPLQVLTVSSGGRTVA